MSDGNNQNTKESFVKKLFEKDHFKVKKIDKKVKYKCPDFLITKDNISLLIEVKQGLKVGKKIKEIIKNKAFEYSPFEAVEDYFRLAQAKYYGYLKHNKTAIISSYIVVFTTPFFIQNELCWESKHYRNFPEISAVFIPKQKHPLDAKAKNMSLEQLEKIINSKKIPYNSQCFYSWDVIKNPYAIKKLKQVNFTKIDKLIYPTKSTN